VAKATMAKTTLANFLPFEIRGKPHIEL